jgi:hypothetical protein
MRGLIADAPSASNVGGFLREDIGTRRARSRNWTKLQGVKRENRLYTRQIRDCEGPYWQIVGAAGP